MAVYVRSLRGGVKKNEVAEFDPEVWAELRGDPALPDMINDFRRKNSQSDYIPVNPLGPNTPGAPMAVAA